MAARSQTDYIKRALDRQSDFRTAVLYRPQQEAVKDVSLNPFDSTIFGIRGFLGSLKIHSGE